MKSQGVPYVRLGRNQVKKREESQVTSSVDHPSSSPLHCVPDRELGPNTNCEGQRVGTELWEGIQSRYVGSREEGLQAGITLPFRIFLPHFGRKKIKRMRLLN